MQVCRWPVPAIGAVSTGPSVVAVYIALSRDRCAVAKFQVRSLGQSSRGSTLIFGDIGLVNFPKKTV